MATAWEGPTAANGEADVLRLAGVLTRLGVGEVLRLRSAPGSAGLLGEVHARPDGTLEVPGPLVGDGRSLALFTRDRIAELAGRLLAVRAGADLGRSADLGRGADRELDLDLATVVDAAGRERTLAGAPVVVGDDDPARFDASLAEQVQRSLAHRTGGPLRAFSPDPEGNILLVVHGGTVLIEPILDGRRLRISTPLVTDLPPHPERADWLLRLRAGRSRLGLQLLRLAELDGTVWAEAVLPAWPFVGAHLDQVLSELDANVLAVVEVLHQRFGGERLYPEGGGTARDQRDGRDGPDSSAEEGR